MGDVLHIPLTQGKVALVDAADYDRVAAFKWCAGLQRHVFYAIRAGSVRMHNFITGWDVVDHINGDGLDNRRANLRPVTVSQNNANARIRRDNASGYKGVSFHRPNGKWKAQINDTPGHRKSLGYFATAEEAAIAYDEAARAFHGEYDSLNFPGLGERGARR